MQLSMLVQPSNLQSFSPEDRIMVTPLLKATRFMFLLMLRLIFKGTLTATSNDSWDEVRRFTIKELNEIGFGRRATEQTVMSYMNLFLGFVSTGPPSVCLSEKLMAPICHYVWAMMTGHELSLESACNLRDAVIALQK